MLFTIYTNWSYFSSIATWSLWLRPTEVGYPYCLLISRFLTTDLSGQLACEHFLYALLTNFDWLPTFMWHPLGFQGYMTLCPWTCMHFTMAYMMCTFWTCKPHPPMRKIVDRLTNYWAMRHKNCHPWYSTPIDKVSRWAPTLVSLA